MIGTGPEVLHFNLADPLLVARGCSASSKYREVPTLHHSGCPNNPKEVANLEHVPWICCLISTSPCLQGDQLRSNIMSSRGMRIEERVKLDKWKVQSLQASEVVKREISQSSV
jgi:hypothetical protein